MIVDNAFEQLIFFLHECILAMRMFKKNFKSTNEMKLIKFSFYSNLKF